MILPSDDVPVNGITPLTVMDDVDGSARSDNGENCGITKASGVCGVIDSLETGTES